MRINQKGMTLLEALIVVALVGLILLISVPLTIQLIRRYKCENEIRRIHASFMEARQRAMQRNVPHLLVVDTNSVAVYEDLDKDGTGGPGEKIQSLSLDAPLYFPLEGEIDGTALPGTATANAKGLISPPIDIRIDNPDSPYNCIATSVTRIGMGKYASTCKIQ
jgi:prepilin-type N-terminal cleavage/methylation domain-containing protein